MTWREPPQGWFTFGTHVDSSIALRFSEDLDDDGLPLWERPALHHGGPGEHDLQATKVIECDACWNLAIAIAKTLGEGEIY